MTKRPDVRRGFRLLKFIKTAILGTALGLTYCGTASANDNLTAKQIVPKISAGGYVIYFRHAATEKDYADQVSADPNNCSTQRTLSETGWRQAELIRNSFAKLGIPVGAVVSSQYCRAWQTAKLAFGTYRKDPALNFEPSEEYTADQVEKMKRQVVPMLSSPPAKGTNTVIVGHDDPFEAATGIYPEPQGVAYIVQPKPDGGFAILGSIAPSQWRDIVSGLN